MALYAFYWTLNRLSVCPELGPPVARVWLKLVEEESDINEVSPKSQKTRTTDGHVDYVDSGSTNEDIAIAVDDAESTEEKHDDSKILSNSHETGQNRNFTIVSGHRLRGTSNLHNPRNSAYDYDLRHRTVA